MKWRSYLYSIVFGAVARAAFIICCSTASAQQAQPVQADAPPVADAPYTISAKGAHHAVWSRVTSHTNLAGRIVYRTNSFTELATGMHFLRNDQWVDTDEHVQLTQDGGAATNGQHQVYFSANVNTSGSIHLITPDGQHMRSHIMGLGYADYSTGKSVLIAELQDSVGEVLPSLNQVLYADAFTDVHADIRYSYTKSGMEQDVILREQPPSPSEFGLNPQNVWLQIWTEFIDAPSPQVQTHTNVDSGWQDDLLSFGTMQMGDGKAFTLADNTSLTPIFKHWRVFQQEGRKFLVEEVPLVAIANQLQILPAGVQSPANLNGNPADPSPQGGGGDAMLLRVSDHPLLLAMKKTIQQAGTMRMAHKSSDAKGLVLDYSLVNTSSNVTFQSDTTYFVSGAVTLTGTTTFEGGTVIKYTNLSSAQITLSGPAVFLTGPYRPAVFTSSRDTSVGEVIYSGTNSPSNLNAGIYIVGGASQTNDYKYIRMAFARIGITNSGALTVWNSQFVDCGTAVSAGSGSTITLHNVLMAQGTNCVDTTGVVRGEHLTADQIQTFCGLAYSGAWLTNSIIAGVTNQTGVATVYSVTNGSGLFQTVVGGSYYLSNGSPYRYAGTTNINSILLAALSQKTTQPPISLPNGISANTTLYPEVSRDTNDSIDIGYHYDPIDYLVTGSALSATLTILNGTVLGFYGGGFGMAGDSKFVSTGAPLQLNRLVWFNTAQENASADPNSTSGNMFDDYWGGDSVEIDCRFTQFYRFASSWNTLIFPMGDGQLYTFNIRDCEFWNGDVRVTSVASDFDYDDPGSSCYLNFTNCLFVRCASHYEGDWWPVLVTMVNNNYRGGSVELGSSDLGNDFVVRNNLFDATAITQSSSYYTLDYNAYLTNCDRLSPAQPHDIVLTSNSYNSGLLGDFYLMTNSPLINYGSTNAASMGFFHYTTQTNQLKETNSTVDIGYHYIALDAYGYPDDTDGDGLADYLEDSNGNGSYDFAGDLGNWQASSTCGDGISDFIKYLHGQRLNICTTNSDSSGLIGLQVYTPLK